MITRRRFVRAVSGAVTTTCGLSTLLTVEKANSARRTSETMQASSTSIRAAVPRDDTIVRYDADADIFPMTWTRDDRQFASFSDGFGWSAKPKKFYNTRALWVDGGPVNATFREVDAYPDPSPQDAVNEPPYYGFSALATGDRIYQLMSCLQKPSDSGRSWSAVKLIYSSDQGGSWHNQDGSTPVVWEPYAGWSRRTMLFVDEPQQAFSLTSFLQMGKSYEVNRDGYVYGYGTNGNTDGTMNQLVMFRAPKDQVLDRNAYEFFGGLKSINKVIWARDIRERAVVHTFPPGWVNRPRGIQNVVQAWLPSVVYNAPLGVYLMASSGVGCPSDGDWFGNSKPSYLGLWSAPCPWGPWHQFYENTAWTPGNDAAARCYSPQIAPKWIAADGKSFWIVWSDYQNKCDKDESKRVSEAAERITNETEKARFQMQNRRRCRPYYSFNTQRIDLVVV